MVNVQFLVDYEGYEKNKQYDLPEEEAYYWIYCKICVETGGTPPPGFENIQPHGG